MKITYIIIICSWFLIYCDIEKLPIEKARKIVFDSDYGLLKEFYSNFTNKSSLLDSNKILNQIEYEDCIVSPFHNHQIFRIRSKSIEPNYFTTFVLSKDSLFVLPAEEKYSYIDSILIKYLNTQLIYEKMEKQKELLTLFYFYNELKNPPDKFEIILDSWKDVVLKENEIIPDRLKKIIRKPYIIKTRKGMKVVGYIWDQSSGSQSEVSLYYENGQISLYSKSIANYGERYISL
jgi:hypothetical protein